MTSNCCSCVRSINFTAYPDTLIVKFAYSSFQDVPLHLSVSPAEYIHIQVMGFLIKIPVKYCYKICNSVCICISKSRRLQLSVYSKFRQVNIHKVFLLQNSMKQRPFLCTITRICSRDNGSPAFLPSGVHQLPFHIQRLKL